MAQPRMPAGAARVPTSALLSPDANVVAAQESGIIRVWDRASGRMLASIPDRELFRGCLARRALIGIAPGGIRVWRGPGFRKAVSLARLPKALAMGRALLSPNGKVAAAIYPHDGGVGDPDTVGLWDAASGQPRGVVRLTAGRVLGAALSDDGTRLAVFGDHAGLALLRVHRLDRASTREILAWSSEAERTTYAAAFSPDHRWLALGAGPRLLVWAMNRKEPALVGSAALDAIKALFPAQLRPSVSFPGAHQIAFSPDGTQLSTLHAFGVVGVATWRLAAGSGPSRAALRPTAWVKRPKENATMRQVSWDDRGRLWLVSSTFGPSVWVHTARGDEFALERVLAP